MLLQSSPCTPSSCVSPGAHTQLDKLFTSLPFCSLPSSFWRLGDPTFLVVWLKSWGFTLHDYVSLCGQAARRQRIKEIGILLFLLGLQFLCERTGIWELSEPTWVLLPLPPLLAGYLRGTKTSVKGIKQKSPGDFPHSPLSIGISFLLLRPEIEGFSGTFPLCLLCAVSAFETRLGDSGGTESGKLASGMVVLPVLVFFLYLPATIYFSRSSDKFVQCF